MCHEQLVFIPEVQNCFDIQNTIVHHIKRIKDKTLKYISMEAEKSLDNT